MRRLTKIFLFLMFSSLLGALAFSKLACEIWIPSSGTILTPPPTETNYVIGVYNSTHYYAQNSSTGAFEWVLASATTLFRNVINNLPTGGKILVRDGIYYGYIDLIGKNGIIIEGESRENTVICMPAGVTNKNNIYIEDVSNIWIKNLKIYGNRAQNSYQGRVWYQNGVWIEGEAHGVTFDNIWVDNTPRQGLEYNSYDGGNTVTIINSLFTDCGWNGITIVVHVLGENIVIDNCEVTGVSDVGISTYGGQGVTVQNTIIHDNNGTAHSPVNTHTAIGIEADETTPTTGTGPKFINVTAYNNYAGLYVLNSNNNVCPTFQNVSFHSNEYGITYAGSATGPIVVNGSTLTGSLYFDLRVWANANVEVTNTLINRIQMQNNNAGSNFLYNTITNPSLSISGSTIIWDDGLRGNYWSNYAGTDANGDGIGDTPYVIDTNNKDNYPLMTPP